MILAIWVMPPWGFVRGHKNMSHIRKWRKIVLIINVLEQISVGRSEHIQRYEYVAKCKILKYYIITFELLLSLEMLCENI